METGPLPSRVDTLVVGAGQAGLVMSSFLSVAGRDHLLLERRDRLGGGWLDRWDAFCLVTPNWTASLPGFAYDGADPDGFMPRDEIAGRIARYAEVIHAPVRLGTEVRRVSGRPTGGFDVATDDGVVRAGTVVVATGGFHVPRVPAVSHELPARVVQLHSHLYRNERELPPGAVLVVGSAQSGVQIVEELQEAGRTVFLSVGSAPRVPRRYRGADIFRWMSEVAARGPAIGIQLPTAETLPDPRMRLAANGHLSGHGGGHEVDLRQLAAGGITLAGHLDGADGETVRFAPDLARNLASADRWFDERLRPLIDAFIERAGIDAPPDDRRPLLYDPPGIAELDLAAAGISTVIWASGYRMDFSWVDGLPLDDLGFPRHRRGISEIPGLAFLGLPWQHTQLSAALPGVGPDGRYLAGRMGLVPEGLPA